MKASKVEGSMFVDGHLYTGIYKWAIVYVLLGTVSGITCKT